MRTRRFLTLGLIALGSLALAADGEVTLQRTLVENSIDNYKITSKVNQTLDVPQMGGKHPLNIVSDLTYKLETNKVDKTKGTADVKTTTTVENVDFGDSPIAQMLANKKPLPVVQDGTIDKYGHLSLKEANGGDPAVEAVMGASGTMQASMFVELPDHPVKVGDTWDIVIAKGPFTGDADQKLTAKLTGEKKVDGKDAWTIDVSGSLNVSFDSAKAAASAGGAFAQSHVTVTGTTTLQGTGLVEKATGKTLSFDTTGVMKSKIHLDPADLSATSDGTISTSVKLKAPEPTTAPPKSN